MAQFLADSNESEMFAQVLQKSVRTALKLKSLGVKRGDVICLNTDNHGNVCVPYIAAQFLKCTITSLDPNLSAEETRDLLKLVKPNVMFLSENALKLVEDALVKANMKIRLVIFGETKKYTPFSEFLQANDEENTFEPVREGTNEDIAIIFFSSGTTGLPKAVCINHRTMMIKSLINADYVNFYSDFKMTNYCCKAKEKDATKEDVILIFSPFYWMTASMFLNSSIFSGAARVVCKEFNSVKYFALIEKYKVTVSFLATKMASEINNVDDFQKNDTSSLRIVIVGGSAVSEEIITGLTNRIPSAFVSQGYGSTEMGGFISVFQPGDRNDRELLLKKPLSCGRFIEGMTAKVRIVI